MLHEEKSEDKALAKGETFTESDSHSDRISYSIKFVGIVLRADIVNIVGPLIIRATLVKRPQNITALLI